MKNKISVKILITLLGIGMQTSVMAQDLNASVEQLSNQFSQEVPNAIPHTQESDTQWVEMTQKILLEKNVILNRPQSIIVVDRNPHVQQLKLMVIDPATNHWFIIGATKVSTGQAGRFDHYITPVGVFPHNGDILDYRAEGTYNENHIRGYGVKGMRVWDLGWQNAKKGWRKDGETGDIRLEMHATDPDVLEQRLGTPASQGCIRIPATLNRFFDKHGILDYDYESLLATNKKYLQVLRSDRTPSDLAGDMIVVIDSAE